MIGRTYADAWLESNLRIKRKRGRWHYAFSLDGVFYREDDFETEAAACEAGFAKVKDVGVVA